MKKKATSPISHCLIIMISASLVLPACEDEDKKTLLSEIEFSLNLQNVMEGNEATILLTLDKPAPENGSVELILETNAIYNQHYVTDPSVSNQSIILNISKGQKSADLKISTINNARYEGTRFIIFKLNSLSQALRLGAATTLTLTIGDDEGPSLANFTVNSAILNEKEENGIVVEIPLSAPALGEGSVTVTLNAGKAVNKTHFIIDQELNNNAFSFNVVPNATSFSFTVFPVDNDLFTDDFILAFSISEISGVVQKGNNLKYSLKIVDDERPSVARFAAPSGALSEINAEGIVVEIILSAPAKGEGQIGITFPSGNAVYGADFTTLPASNGNSLTVSLSHDQTSASFTVFPVNNDLLKENLIRSFWISQVSGVVRKDNKDQSYELNFVDDEEPSIANFALASATVDEVNIEGIDVEIHFSNPTAGSGQITLEVEQYNANFISDPEGAEVYEYFDYDTYSYRYSYQITLDVPQYAERVSFKILPIDDDRCAQHVPATFSIASVSGVIRKGNNQTFDLTIKDDEAMILVILTEMEGTLNENEISGKEIRWSFTNPARADGSIIVYSGNYDAGRYTTVPAMVYDSGYGYYVSVNFKKGDTGVKFKVLPINDNIAKSNFTDSFNLSSYQDEGPDNGCVEMQDLTYRLTIVDDD